jgi:tetratricopeptide (TPR) repeat protein
VLCTQVIGAAYYSGASSEKLKSGEMKTIKKKFNRDARKLMDMKEFDQMLALSEKYIKKYPKEALFHQFKGLALVMRYADNKLTRSKATAWMVGESDIKKAISEFETARKLQPANEDKALAAKVLAYIVSNNMEKAASVYEPAIIKYPKSVHLKYVGIKYYDNKKLPALKAECEKFIKDTDPYYDGKPVFGGIGIAVSLWSLVKILTTAIITAYVAGFERGRRMRNAE